MFSNERIAGSCFTQNLWEINFNSEKSVGRSVTLNASEVMKTRAVDKKQLVKEKTRPFI